MKLLSASLLTASLLTYTYADSLCLSPLVNKGECIAYKKKKFVSVDCDSKDAKKLKFLENGELCSGGKGKSRCLIRKANKQGVVQMRMSKSLEKGQVVIFQYNQDENDLVMKTPYAIKGKFPVFKDGKIKFNGKRGDVKCSNVGPTTAAPTTASVPINTVSITSRVNITQNSNKELHVKKTASNGFTSIFIEKACDYFNVKIIRYARFNSIGMSIKQDPLFKTWLNGIDLGIRKNTIGSFSQHGTKFSRVIYNNLNPNNNYHKTFVDRHHNNGETIKVSKTDTVIEFSRAGKSYHRYVFRSGDRKDLYPAIDIYYAGDEYIISMY